MTALLARLSPSYFEYSRIFGYFLRFDRVVLATAAVLLAIWVLLPGRIVPTLAFTAGSVLDIAPFLAVSVLLAGYLKASGADGLIARAFASGPVRAVFLAALVGAMAPFCSCGVIPLVAALLASGVPLAPVMAFWLASPVMDPEMFVLTAAVLGVPFATVKMLAAVAIGLLGGAVVLLLQRRAFLQDPLAAAVSTCGARAVTDPRPPVWRFWSEPERRAGFLKEVRRAGWFLFKWLTLAFVLESLMLAHVPMDQVGAWLARAGAWAIPAAAAVGVPSYMNGYAAIPLTSALMEMGLTPAAALTFMTAGAVTSIPAAIAVKALVRLPVFLLYLAIALSGSILIGLTYAALG